MKYGGLVDVKLVFISWRTESGDGDARGGYDGPSDCVRSHDGPDRCGDITGGGSGADGVDAGEVVGGADTDGGVSCCSKTVGGSANVTGSDAVCSGKNCPRGINQLVCFNKEKDAKFVNIMI